MKLFEGLIILAIVIFSLTFFGICEGKGFSFNRGKDCPPSGSLRSIPPPEILIETTGTGFNSRIPSVEKSVELVDDSEFSRSYFDCRHSTPVQWIMDIHPSRDAFQFTRSFYQRISNTSFSAYVVFLYKPGDQGDLKTPILFICASVCPGVPHNFLEVTPGEYSALIQRTLKPSTPLFVALAWKLLNSTTGSSAPQGCDLALDVKVIHDFDRDGSHALFYIWRAAWTEGITLEKQLLVQPSWTRTDQGIYFRNVFRTVPQRRDCVRVLYQDDPCTGCSQVTPQEQEGHGHSLHINSVAFYARSNTGVKMAFKAVFSMTRPRRLYFDWELENSSSPLLQELVDFRPPPVIYAGHEVILNCSVSSIYFAYGTLIYASTIDDFYNVTSQNEIDPSQTAPFEGNSGDSETWIPDGGRIVRKGTIFQTGNETVTLTCSAPLWNWSDRVEKSVQVLVDFPVSPEIQGGSWTEERIVENNEENVTLFCSAYGKPRPILEWVLPSENISDWIEIIYDEEATNSTDEDDNENRISSTISIPRIHRQVLGTYLCRVSNIFGDRSKSFTLKIPKKGLSTSIRVGLSSGVGIVALLGLITAGAIYRKIILQRREYATKTAEAIREFKEGVKRAQLEKDKVAAFFSSEPFQKKGRHLDKLGEEVDDIDEGEGKGGDESIHKDQEYGLHPNQSILELPYDSRFEVDLDNWIIEETLLGSGTFGVVRKGGVNVGNKRHTVAVKVLKTTVEIEDFKSFLTELKIMAYIGKHPNIVSLVAACTQNIEQRDVMIGVEFCSNGSLQDYLTEKRSMFSTESSEIRSSSGLNTYSNMWNSVALTELDLFTWSYQIANGMEFLAKKNVLHGDLASRNVLLTSDKTAKISDFGLSRVLLEANKNYVKKSRVPLPWKWMAIESLKSLKFSSASDVWAFGVTIFEIFSLGEIPYAGLSFGPEFIAQLESGFRLAKPPLATEYIYNIMKHCWNPVVEHRSTFPQLKTAFSELLDVFTNPRGAPVPLGRNRLNTPSAVFQNSPVATPRRLRPCVGTTPQPPAENWYSNRPIQIPNLYLNV